MKDVFAQVVAAVNAEHVRDNAPVEIDAEAIDEIKEHLDWVLVNLDEGDADIVKLENLACAVAAAQRFAGVLLARIPEHEAHVLVAKLTGAQP